MAITSPLLSHQPTGFNGVDLSLDELLYYRSQTVRWLPPARSVWSQQAGQHQSRQIGRGMDFSEVRQYQAGDDIRAIDWRVTARTGKPHTKLFSEEREKPVILFVDFSHSMRFGSTLMLKSVQTAHMASLIGWLTVTQQDRIGAVLDTGNELVELKPRPRQQGALALIQQLMACHQQARHASHPPASPSLTQAFQTLLRLCPKGSEVILLSDFVRFLPEHQPLLAQLRQHNVVRFVHFVDPLELGKTAYRGVERVSDRHHTQWLDFSSRRTRHQIEQAFESKQQQLHTYAASLGIHVTTLSSDQPLLSQLSG